MADQAQAEENPEETPADLFVRILGVERSTAEILVANQMTTIEELAYVPLNELTDIKRLDQSLALQIRERAKLYLHRQVTGDE